MKIDSFDISQFEAKTPLISRVELGALPQDEIDPNNVIKSMADSGIDSIEAIDVNTIYAPFQETGEGPNNAFLSEGQSTQPSDEVAQIFDKNGLTEVSSAPEENDPWDAHFQ